MNTITPKKLPPIALASLSALLLSLAWYLPFASLLLFVAFVPLWKLEIQISEDVHRHKRLRVFGWSYLTFLCWNTATTWWVYNSTLVGTVVMIVLNTLLMTIPFVLFSFSKKVVGEGYGIFAFLIYWLSLEHLHLHWELNWPWLTIGNGFALNPEWVQWYEVTGALGGTLWVILTNIFAFKAWCALTSHNRRVYSIYAFCILIIPMITSYIIYYTYQEKGEDFEVVVIQPNIDPFQEKFKDSPNFIPFDQQIKRFISLSQSMMTPKTKLVLWPETAIDDALTEKGIEQYTVFQKVHTFISKYPNASLITGLTSVEWYDTQQTLTARENGNQYYDIYNTAMYIDPNSKTTEFYHKRKLVPAVETMPYIEYLGGLGELMLDLGGTSGGYGKENEAKLFVKDKVMMVPLICFESVFGDLMTEYKGANLLCIITNDGWWGNTPGHQQHMHFASLRAIELRKDVARSANTGISCFINQRGDILNATKYWEQDAIRATLKTNDLQTIYAKYGDYIGRLAGFLASFFLLGVVVKWFTNRRQPKA